MKTFKYEVHEPADGGGTKITYHMSIRAAVRYCKKNHVTGYIFTRNNHVYKMTFGNEYI